MPSLTGLTRQKVNFRSGLKQMLNHSNQRWHEEKLKNRSYMLQHLTRHLLEAGLLSELWSLVLDPKWMSVGHFTDGVTS